VAAHPRLNPDSAIDFIVADNAVGAIAPHSIQIRNPSCGSSMVRIGKAGSASCRGGAWFRGIELTTCR
jgi:hypothetical protein